LLFGSDYVILISEGGENMKSHIDVPKDKIDAFCRQHHISALGLFGPVLHEDFRANSGIGILAGFEQQHIPEPVKLGVMREELTKIFGQTVDLVELRAVEKSANRIRRRHILKSVESIFAA